MKPQARRVHFLEREDLERAGLSTEKFFTNDGPTSDPYNRPTWTEKLIALAVLTILAFITIAVLWWIFVAVLLVAALPYLPSLP